MSRHPLLALFLTLLAVTLACGTDGPTATPQTARLETVVAATVAALPAITQPSEPALTAAPPSPQPTTTSLPTATLPCLPAHPGAQSLPLPAGFAAGINTLAVEFFNLNGDSLGAIQTPGMTWMAPDQLHIGGGLNNGLNLIALAYNSLESGGIIKVSQGGVAQYRADAPNLVALTGGAGTSELAFSRYDSDATTGGWVSWLYAGEAEAINGAQPLLTYSQGDGFVLYPLAVHVEGGIARGVWYTLSMWGIGNIIFAPYNGLYYFDFASQQTSEFLPFTDRLAGFSPDQTMVAYLSGGGGQPGGNANALTVRDLLTCHETVIPFNPASNLGGGFVVFSPDNQYLAWLEASGPNPMESQMRLRVAHTNGALMADSPTNTLSSLAGGEIPVYIKPVAWAANHLLLLEIGVAAQNAPLLVVWAPDPAQTLDPALGANQSALLAQGVFAGIVYP